MKILIVDDDPDIVDAVAVALQFHWQDVTILTAYGGEQGAELFYQHNPDLVLLDVAMPGRSGFDVLRELRRVSDVPVIMLTGRSDETDIVRGLDVGADDYITKPFSHLTLLARIKAVLRRAHVGSPGRTASDFVAGELAVNFESQEVRLRGEPVQLTPAEYRLLYHLVRNAGRLLPHQVLLERVWGAEWGATTNNLKALVSRLRSKLGPSESGADFIENERGLGYRFVRPPERSPNHEESPLDVPS
ncbi:MAG TPA: response regulator transcription factor [Chloroflexota bacterium]|nr:response regulator transcription factor [Chloroflexota bacterium]